MLTIRVLLGSRKLLAMQKQASFVLFSLVEQPSFPFPSAGHKKKKKNEVSSAFAAGTQKCLHSKDVFTLRMRSVEDERREERRILSY